MTHQEQLTFINRLAYLNRYVNGIPDDLTRLLNSELLTHCYLNNEYHSKLFHGIKNYFNKSN